MEERITRAAKGINEQYDKAAAAAYLLRLMCEETKANVVTTTDVTIEVTFLQYYALLLKEHQTLCGEIAQLMSPDAMRGWRGTLPQFCERITAGNSELNARWRKWRKEVSGMLEPFHSPALLHVLLAYVVPLQRAKEAVAQLMASDDAPPWLRTFFHGLCGEMVWALTGQVVPQPGSLAEAANRLIRKFDAHRKRRNIATIVQVWWDRRIARMSEEQVGEKHHLSPGRVHDCVRLGNKLLMVRRGRGGRPRKRG